MMTLESEPISKAGSPHPLVSIIVPSYNQGAFIRDTLDSILEQDYRPLEVIVMDGASTDGTLDVLHDYDDVPEVSWISEPDSGVVEAVNKGLARANGKICAIQSSDDVYLPGAVRTAVARLTEDPKLGFVYGDIVKVDADGNELSREKQPPYSLESMLVGLTWIPQPSTFFRLDLARSLGGWRDEVSFAADTELWFRMAFRGRAEKLDVFMAARRMHPDQRDTNGSRIARDYARMLDELPELKTAPPRIRRAAAAGRLLKFNRYGENEGYWPRLFRLWRACVAYPHLVSQIPAGSLLPGWYAARRLLTRVSSG